MVIPAFAPSSDRSLSKSNVKVYCPSPFIVTGSLFSVNPLANSAFNVTFTVPLEDFLLTLIATIVLTPLAALTIMYVFPAFSAVTLPEPLTVAIDVLEDVYVIASLLSAGVNDAFNVNVSPSVIS